MSEYSPQEFKRQLIERGYVVNPDRIRHWMRDHRQEHYTEEDMEQAYRDTGGYIGCRSRPWDIMDADAVMWDDHYKEGT